MQKYFIYKSAKICNILNSTAFIWRHKILDALQNRMNEVELNGILEANETFMSYPLRAIIKILNYRTQSLETYLNLGID